MRTVAAFDLVKALLAAYATNERINQYVIQHLPAEAWDVAPPGGKGRTIPGIVAHMHNVRLMWLKAAAANGVMPAKLEGDNLTPQDAIAGLQQSFAASHKLLQQSLESDGRIKGFKPDAASFLGYLLAHDAHHRGQISMLARQAGHPLPKTAMFGMWEWGTR